MIFLKKFTTNLFAEITSVPPALHGGHYQPIDGLRGVSILFVLLYHFGINHFLKPFNLVIIGRMGVDIFFVISGFLITTILLKEKLTTGSISLKKFYVRRILRIVPVVYLFLIVLLVIFSCYGVKVSRSNFILSFLFLKNLPLKSGLYTQHLWSLAVEFQFYLFFPALLVYSTNKYLVTAFFIIVLVPLIAVAGFYHVSLFYGNPVISLVTKTMMYIFWNGPVIILTGSVAAILTFKGIIKINRLNTNYFFSFFLLIAAFLFRTPTFLFYSKYISEYLFAIIMAYIILLTINSTNLLSNILKNRGLIKIGVLSYSLYIWQQLFIGINSSQPWLHIFIGYPYFAVFLFKILVVFLISSASYYFFEAKFLILKRLFK